MKLFQCEPPYKAAKSSGYMTFQRQGEPIYDGRYPALPAERIDTRAPPIQLYNPVFGQFLGDIANKDLEVPTEVILATSRFMDLASGIYKDEDHRTLVLQKELMAAISVVIHKVDNIDMTKPDSIVTTEVLVGGESKLAAICIKEDKNEIGDGNSDPSIQAGLSYGRFWAQKNVRALNSSLYIANHRGHFPSKLNSARIPAVLVSFSRLLAHQLLY